jgi:hypothetical protein
MPSARHTNTSIAPAEEDELDFKLERTQRYVWTGREAHLDVMFPNVHEEETDAFVVLDIVQDDQFHYMTNSAEGERSSATTIIYTSSTACRDMTVQVDLSPEGATKAETFHSLNLSIIFRYMLPVPTMTSSTISKLEKAIICMTCFSTPCGGCPVRLLGMAPEVGLEGVPGPPRNCGGKGSFGGIAGGCPAEADADEG